MGVPKHNSNNMELKKLKSDMEDSKAKVILIGDSNVGKTSILGRLIDDTFMERQTTTIGVEFRQKTLSAPHKKPLKFLFWDICGMDRYNAVINSFYKGCDAAIFVYDISDVHSFQNVSKWMKYFERTPRQPKIKILLGNKLELYPKVVPFETAQDFATRHNMPLFEVSAKEGTNIKESFTEISDLLQYSEPEFTEIDLVEDVEEIKPKSCYSCCKLWG